MNVIVKCVNSVQQGFESIRRSLLSVKEGFSVKGVATTVSQFEVTRPLFTLIVAALAVIYLALNKLWSFNVKLFLRFCSVMFLRLVFWSSFSFKLSFFLASSIVRISVAYGSVTFFWLFAYGLYVHVSSGWSVREWIATMWQRQTRVVLNHWLNVMTKYVLCVWFTSFVWIFVIPLTLSNVWLFLMSVLCVQVAFYRLYNWLFRLIGHWFIWTNDPTPPMEAVVVPVVSWIDSYAPFYFYANTYARSVAAMWLGLDGFFLAFVNAQRVLKRSTFDFFRNWRILMHFDGRTRLVDIHEQEIQGAESLLIGATGFSLISVGVEFDGLVRRFLVTHCRLVLSIIAVAGGIVLLYGPIVMYRQYHEWAVGMHTAVFVARVKAPGWIWFVVSGVIGEELLKAELGWIAARLFGSHQFAYGLFATLELIWKIKLGFSPTSFSIYLPYILHCLTGYMSLSGAIVLHLVWNLVLFGYGLGPLAMFGNRRLHFPNARERDLIRRRIGAKEDVHFSSRNYHPRKNRELLERLLAGEASVKMKGVTTLDDYTFAFPFSGTRREFLRVLDIIDSHPDRRDLCLYGILSRRLYLAHSECFFQPAVREDFYDEVDMMGLSEEAELMLGNVEEVSFVADVLYKMSRKDWLGLAFSGGMKAKAMANLLFMTNLSSPKELGDLLKLDDGSSQCSIEEVTMMGLSETVLDFIPKKFSSSPNLRRLLAFVCLLSMAPFVRDLAMVRSASQFVAWDTMPTGQSFMETSLNGAAALYNVLGNAVSGKTSLVEILGMPKNVSFISRARVLTVTDFSNATVQEVERALVEIDELQESRKFLYNDAEINKLKDRLEALTKSLVGMLANAQGRSEPMFIGLLGVPGTGKTTLMTVICDVLRRVMDVTAKPNDVIHYNITDKFPVESCKFPQSGLFLCLNDVPSNYSEYRKLDMLPLDILLQRVIDTSPLDFRSADVPDKGILVNHLSHMILSSNMRKFAGAEDASKLLRRVNNGLTVWTSFRVNGKEVAFDDLPKNMSESERNDCIRFTVQKPYANGIAFGFEDTQITLSLQEFLRMLVDKHLAHQQKIADTAAVFTAESAKCVCGVPHIMHWTHGEYRQVFEVCSRDPIFEKRWAYYVPPVESRWSKFLDWMRPRLKMKSHSIVSTLFGWAYSGLCGYFMWALYSCDFRALVQGFYDVFRLGRQTSWIDILMSFPLLRSSFLLHAVVFKPQEYEQRKLVLYVVETVVKLRRFVLDNKRALIAGGLVMSAYWMMNRLRPDVVESKGRAIFRDQVDPGSMFVYEKTREQRWTPEQMRTWGKEDSEIEVLKLHKTGVGADTILKRAGCALRKIKVRTPDMHVESGHAVLWNAEWAGANKHFFKHAKGGRVSIEIDGMEQLYESSEILQMPGTEHVLFKNYFDKTVMPLSDFLPADVGSGPWWAYLTLSCDEAGATPRSFQDPNSKETFKGIHVEKPCVEGDCGNLLIINSPQGHCVAGVLSAGINGTNNSYYTIVSRGAFSAATSRVPFPEVHSYIHDVPQMMGLSHNSDFRHFNYPLLKVLGTLCEPTRAFRTRIVRTVLWKRFESKMVKKFVPPKKVAGLTPSGEYKSSLLHTFEFVSLPFRSTDTELLEAGLDWLNTAIPAAWVKEKKISLRPCDVAESVFGDTSIGLDRINFKTSCGKEWRERGVCDKFDLFDEVEDDSYVMKPEFRDALAELLVHYRNGDIPALRVDFSPKDELRPEDKVDNFALRYFGVVGVHRNLLQRGFLMPIILILLSYPFQSECFGQMNAASFEWSALANHLRKFGNFIDIDFKKMDTSHKLQVIELVARLFYLASIRLGYVLWEAVVCYMSVKALMLQLLICENDVAWKMFGLPSGVIITLIMNSIVNSVLMRVAFFRLCPGLKFRDHVSPATTGDDNASGISDEVIGRYNMLTLVSVYQELGYVITPAKKDSLPTPSIAFEDLTFLKRRFVWSDEMGAYLAPIETDSIFKALCYQSKEGNVHPNVRLQQVALGCQREAFMHGRAFFDNFQNDLAKAFTEHQIGGFFTRLNYEDLKREFFEKKFRTWMI